MLGIGTRRALLASTAIGRMSGPIGQTMHRKVCFLGRSSARRGWRMMLTCTCAQITEALKPVQVQIIDDSKLHAHHAAMRGNVFPETHFRCAAFA